MYHTLDPDMCVVECLMADQCVGPGMVFAIAGKVWRCRLTL